MKSCACLGYQGAQRDQIAGGGETVEPIQAVMAMMISVIMMMMMRRRMDQILCESNVVIQADSDPDGNHVKGRIHMIGIRDLL